MKGLFITGTDTGVGKTIVSASLCRLLRSRGIDAVAIKPFATGIGPETYWRDNDPLVLSAAMDNIEPPEVISPARLCAPLSPYDSARLNKTTLDLDAISVAVKNVAARHQFAVIEGVGGVQVPLTESVFVSDFAKHLGLNALLVARSKVGTINHSLLSVAALRQAGIHVEGIVFTRFSKGELSLDEQVGPETAARLARVSNFGLVDFSKDLDTAGSLEDAINALPVASVSIIALADHIEQSMLCS